MSSEAHETIGNRRAPQPAARLMNDPNRIAYVCRNFEVLKGRGSLFLGGLLVLLGFLTWFTDEVQSGRAFHPTVLTLLLSLSVAGFLGFLASMLYLLKVDRDDRERFGRIKSGGFRQENLFDYFLVLAVVAIYLGIQAGVLHLPPWLSLWDASLIAVALALPLGVARRGWGAQWHEYAVALGLLGWVVIKKTVLVVPSRNEVEIWLVVLGATHIVLGIFNYRLLTRKLGFGR